ncbi:DNA mismatch repair endonuclease MutL [Desulfovibrio sp. OttesenSCG-928-C06]|nr:DNA mismatch repair endonuclease MutL [Desulfovibrio sp. OttesenSCG-928-C06]
MSNTASNSRRIKLLPPELRDQIAAGEVVERPASVLKELLENSLDAGADEIIVKIENGGQSYLSVRDNGRGINAEDLHLAVTSHATSKIRSFEELLRVSSYGFRGEALPSIASVSKMRVSSFASESGQDTAFFIQVDYGKKENEGPDALPYGTLIEVKELFSNVPARLKFLKTNATELKRCQEVVVRAALARTDVTFILESGGREVCRFMKGEDLRKRLEKIWPPQVTSELSPFDFERNSIKVRGLAGHPRAAQAKGDRMLFYVNGRPVSGGLLQRAAREAYKGRLLAREYPQVALFIELDPEEVDVNVHPAKTEVRFRDERGVFGAVLRAVESALSAMPGVSASYAPSGTNAADSDPERPAGFWGLLDTRNVTRMPRADDNSTSEDRRTFAYNPSAATVAENASRFMPDGVPSGDDGGASGDAYGGASDGAFDQTLAQASGAAFGEVPEDAETAGVYPGSRFSGASTGSAGALSGSGQPTETGSKVFVNDVSVQSAVLASAGLGADAPPTEFELAAIHNAWSQVLEMHGDSPDIRPQYSEMTREESSACATDRQTVLDARQGGPASAPGALMYLGQVADTYLIVMKDGKLMLLDQHAVHERILMHRFTSEASAGQVQFLAFPLELTLHVAEHEKLLEIWPYLQRLGFSIKITGSLVLQVNGIPALLERSEARDFLREAMAGQGNGLHDLLAMMSCKGAIKAGQRLSNDEIMGLLRQWMQTPDREFCPHGRPAVLVLGADELEKMFKRR